MRILVLAAVSIGLTACGNTAQKGQTDLLQRLAYEKGEVVWRVRETNRDGSENRECFRTPHNGGVVYWPSHHRLAFTLNQGALPKTMSVTFASKPEHEVTFYWDQISESMSVSVDGRAAQKREVGDGAGPWQLTCPF